MNRRQFVISAVGMAAGIRTAGAHDRATVNVDLERLATSNGFRLSNRTATGLEEGLFRGARLSEAAGEGVAFIPGSAFDSGTIELALRGKDIPQRSFIGVAFHGVDATAYDAVYFRPFNFKAGDPVGRSHAVQYHSIPGYTWDVLRGRFPGKYEQAVNPVPDPNGWFRARVEVKNRVASVFVDNATGPSLVVELLGKSNGGLIGLWVGNTSGGDFANLSISAA